MMDQNRCLLDVIDNPQLLQSFLESESSAETSNSTNVGGTTTTTATAAATTTTETEAPATATTTELEAATTTGREVATTTETEVETETETETTTTTTSNITTTTITDTTTSTTITDTATSTITDTTAPSISTSPNRTIDGGIIINVNDTNNNNTSSDTGSSSLAIDEPYSQQTHVSTDIPTIQYDSSYGGSFDEASACTISDQNQTLALPAVKQEKDASITMPSNNSPEGEKVAQVLIKQESGTPSTNKDFQPSTSVPTPSTPISSPIVVTASTTKTTPNTTTTTTTTTTTAATTSKRAPRRSTPKATKGKNNKTTNSATNQQQATPTQQAGVSQQFISSTGQQQVVFQTNNTGIRQPAMLASPMGQTLGGMPQQQRVIQIQTANGPMYFAIAPGPAMNSSPMMNQQPGMQSQQYSSQQICFQPNSTVMINRPQLQTAQQQQQQQNRPSSEFIHSNSSTPTSQQSDRPGQFTPELQQTRCLASPQTVTSPQQQQQQIRLQSPVIQYNGQSQSNQMQTSLPNQISVNGLNKNPQMQGQQQFTSQAGPIILQNRSTQGFGQQPQQQIISSQGNNIIVNGQQMIQSQQQHQARLASPMMAGQTLAISNQHNSQQQHIVLPSSQQMMMPRMPNQLILNRPGQLLPGQQQFIQIQTPNGPMLLALPTQTSQPLNNMIDYNNQVQQQQQQQKQKQQSSEIADNSQSTPAKQVSATSSKSVSNSKSGLDLADLLLDCGILPEDRMTASQSPSSVKTSQSPSISQINSPMSTLPQINSPMTPMDSLPTNPPQQSISNYAGQPMQQQPIRITIAPDGQMIMQPTVYGAIRPVLTSSMGQTHLNAVNPNNIVPSSSPMMNLTSSPSTPSNETTADTKKSAAKGKGTAAKRSRSKKSDLDKFPILKTPKIAQQQQQQQQQMQAVTVVPMTVLVGDQDKVLGGSDVKPNVAQLASGQQMSLAKIVTPVMQTASLQPLVNSNMIQTSIPTTNMLATIGQNQANSNPGLNTQLASDSGNSISAPTIVVQNSNTIVGSTTSTLTSSSTSQLSSSGNVTTNLLPRINKPGTVESNPHISSSLMPTISLTVDTLKIEQNGLKTIEGQNQKLKGIQTSSGLTATLVLHQTQAQQHQNQLNHVQQVARQVDLRAQSILNQLGADQNAALNPQMKQSFRSLEDACKRLLRYHVFDTETVNGAQIKRVDEIFEAAAESLITRKNAIYDKFRLLILKQSMKTVPSSEEVMLEHIFVNDEQSFLKRERELFREYEAHLESLALKQSRADSKLDSNKDDCAPDYFAFGENSPKRNNQDDLDSGSHSRDIDDWLLTDKWGKSRYPSVPDSEAATAIESILNEELS